MSDNDDDYFVIPAMSKDNKIKIEGGCHYDYERHVVIHNDGPFTDHGCVHKKGQDERVLADSVSKKYAKEIELAKEGKPKHPNTFISEEQVLLRFKELLLDELDKNIPRLEIRKFEWSFAENSCAFDSLLRFDSYEKKFNCCVYNRRCELSDDFLAHIPSDADAFDSIFLPCIDPEVDIESVTLLAEKTLPKDKRNSLGSDYIFYADLCRTVLVPIRKLTDIRTNRISFASNPIVHHPAVRFWVKIEYKSNLKFSREVSPHIFAIRVEQLLFAMKDRKQLLNSAWKSYCNEPQYEKTVFLK